MDVTRYVSTGYWRDPWIRKLPVDGKLLYLYLFTCDSANLGGIYVIAVETMAFDTGIKPTRVRCLLASFVEAGKISYDEEVIWLRNARKHQTSGSSKQTTCIVNDVAKLHDCQIKADYCRQWDIPYQYPINTLSGTADSSLPFLPSPVPSPGSCATTTPAPAFGHPLCRTYHEETGRTPNEKDRATEDELEAREDYDTTKARSRLLDMILAAKDSGTKIYSLKYFVPGIIERLEGKEQKVGNNGRSNGSKGAVQKPRTGTAPDDDRVAEIMREREQQLQDIAAGQ